MELNNTKFSITVKARIIYAIVAFILSSGILTIIFKINHICPFGDNTMAIWDMDGEYIAFFAWFRNVLHGQANLLATVNGGLWSNTFGLIAYYLASPLNLLLYFFDLETLPYAISLLLIVKTGLSGMTMQIFLNSRKVSFLSIVFSLFYAVNSYTICYQYNIMWLDSLIMLPLVIYSLDTLINTNKGVMYSITLGICVLTNYYTGFMVCLFCILYFACNAIRKTHFKITKTQIKNFITYSLLGGGLSFCVTLPGILSLQASGNNRIIPLGDIINFSPLIDITHLPEYLLAGSFDSGQGILGTFPLIYSGNITVILTILFFFSSNIKFEKKVRYGALLILLLIGIIFKGPNTVWHAFSTPVGCPQRQLFIWIFTIILLSYETIFELTLSSFKDKLGLIFAFLFMSLSLYLSIVKHGLRLAYLADAAITWCSLFGLYIYKANELSKSKLASLTAVCFLMLSICELSYNGLFIHKVFLRNLYSSYKIYLYNTHSYNELAKYIEKEDLYEYRSVIWSGLGDCPNKGYLYNISNINQSSSTEDCRPWKVYNTLGMGTPFYETDPEVDGSCSSLVADILGIKYIIEQNDYEVYETKLADYAGISIYENEDALPLAFLISEDARNIAEENNNLFETQNKILNSLTLNLYSPKVAIDAFHLDYSDKNMKDYFNEMDERKAPRFIRIGENLFTDGTYIASQNREYISKVIANNRQYTTCTSIDKNNITATFNVPQSNTQLYACFSVVNTDDISVKIDNRVINAVDGLGGLLMIPITEGIHSVTLTLIPFGLISGCAVSIICLIILLCLVLLKKSPPSTNS